MSDRDDTPDIMSAGRFRFKDRRTHELTEVDFRLLPVPEWEQRPERSDPDWGAREIAPGLVLAMKMNFFGTDGASFSIDRPSEEPPSDDQRKWGQCRIGEVAVILLMRALGLDPHDVLAFLVKKHHKLTRQR